MQTYRVHQPYAPNRYSASSPSHLHWDPCRGQGRRHRAIDEGQQEQHIVVDYTSSAEAVQAAAVVGGGGSEPVEVRHLD